MDMVTRKSDVSARHILEIWLAEFGQDLPKDEISAVILAKLFPGFIDVSYLYHVWKEMDKKEGSADHV